MGCPGTVLGRTAVRLALGAALLGVLEAAASPFPLRISANRRHLEDAEGRPFLYQADTPWMLFLKLTESEARDYMVRRREQGFTVLQVQLTGFLGGTNRHGELPFAGMLPAQDFTRPNERYFAHVDAVVEEAGRQGLLLAVAPAWSGCCGEGWAGRGKDGSPKPLNGNGADASRAWGRWLGTRFGKHPHLMWILGGDNDPNNAREEIRALGMGLKESAPGQLITYHAASTHSSTDVWPPDEPWLDVTMVYTYFRGFNKAWNKNQPDTWEVSQAEYFQLPVRPFFLGESTYEGEHGDWGSALQARLQAYSCLLGGGCGHAYGSPNWNMPPDWRQVLELPGALSLRHLCAVMESRPWWRLVPDRDHRVAVAGHGANVPNGATVTALADDGSFAMAYLPAPRALTLDLDRVSGGTARAWWFDPRGGNATRIPGDEGTGRRTFEPPGDGDWVLVVDDATRGYPEPGLRTGR